MKNLFENIKLIIIIAISVSLFSCNDSSKNKNGDTDRNLQPDIKIEDVHSLSNFAEVKVEHLDLDVNVDFDNKALVGKAKWMLNNIEGKDTLILDTDELIIDSVFLDENTLANYQLMPAVEHIGSALKIQILPSTKSVTIYYRTEFNETDTFAALQWLEPSQTFGKKYPFLFTQSEPTMSRCWIPCQDAPAVKITYNANVQVPKELMAVMSASNPK